MLPLCRFCGSPVMGYWILVICSGRTFALPFADDDSGSPFLPDLGYSRVLDL